MLSLTFALLMGGAQAAPEKAKPVVQFSPEGQVRPRLEAHSGRDATAGNGGEIYFQQRARLGGTLSYENVFVRVVLQDVRTWGEESNTLKDFSADTFDVPFAYIGWKPVEEFGVQVGRQQWNLHEQRLIGAVGWTAQSRSFDGGLASVKVGSFSADVAGAILADSSSAAQSNDGSMMWLRAGWSPEKAAAVDAVYILDWDNRARRLRSTTGVYAKGAVGQFSGRVEGYAQFGGNTQTNILAWMAAAQVTWSPKSELKPKITLWYDHLSGDDNTGDSDVKAFNTLFATNHKFYGLIDIMDFKKGGKSDGRGLQDIALKTGISPTSWLSLGLHGHAYLPSNAQGGESVIGEEVDLVAKFKIQKHLAFTAGGAMFFPATGDMDMWGFAMLDAKL